MMDDDDYKDKDKSRIEVNRTENNEKENKRLPD